MDIMRRLTETTTFTPVEQNLAHAVLELGEGLRGYSIKEFARAQAVSVASIHRFCKKLGLEGFKELKVEVARASAAGSGIAADVNFPFDPGSTSAEIAPRIEDVYRTTLADTRALLSADELDRAAELIVAAHGVDIYTASHNLYPAETFAYRLGSASFTAHCYVEGESQVRRAFASGPESVALLISYSGLTPYVAQLLPLLAQRNVPVICVGTPQAARRHPGLAAYLTVSDRESLSRRITQFSSHIAVQYVLDVLYGCVFARTYERSMAFLQEVMPHLTPQIM